VHLPLPTLRQPLPELQSHDRPYRAVVVLYMRGGCDSFNLLVPFADCGAHDLQKEYQQVRGSAALFANEMLPIKVPPGTQPCDTFAVHPQLTHLRDMYDAGNASFIANIGGLVEPLTKAEFRAKSKQRPPGLFSHNVMQRSSYNVHAQKAAAEGVLGRILDALSSQAVGRPPYKTEGYSIAGTTKMLDGSRMPDIIHHKKGVERFGLLSKLKNDLMLLSSNVSSSLFADTHNEILTRSLRRSESVHRMLKNVKLSQDFGTDKLSMQFKQVAKIISARRDISTERSAFYVEHTGFDHHSNLRDSLISKFSDINAALTSFTAELKHLGEWENVVVVTASDFGRTLTSNGMGTDHAWGGNMFVVGGAVDGGKILGNFPARLGADTELNVGRGRILPTLSWEALWHGVAEWMGVQPDQMETVLPNIEKFPAPKHRLTMEQLFKEGASR